MNSRIKRVQEIFPELEWISSESLKQKSAEMWAEAWAASDWKDMDLADVPYNQYVTRDTLTTHTRSVVQVAKYSVDNTKENFSIEYDSDIVVAASLLHDVTKLFEMKPKGNGAEKTEIGNKFPHGFMGAQMALQKELPIDIVHMIITHTPMSKFKPKTPEGILLWYVDAMESDILYGYSGYPVSIGGDRIMNKS